jgi:N-acetyl-anhydromuramyl-L-alanine amidase AmpD
MSLQIVGSLTTRELPERQHSIDALLFHTTGDTDLARIMSFYHAPDGLQPHFMIDYDGTVRRIVWEHQVAYHCKIDPAEARLYQRGYAEWSCWKWLNERPVHNGDEFSGYRFWRDEWRAAGMESPLELVTGAHPNSSSIGIELRQPEKPGPDIFTPEQYQAAAELAADLHGRLGVQLDRKHVLGHQDCSPMRRCSAAGGWDPGYAFKWNRLWDLLH